MEMIVAGFREDHLAGGLVVLACLQHLTSLEDGDREELANRIPQLASIGVDMSQGDATAAWEWSQNTIVELQNEQGPEVHPTYQRETQLKISAKREVKARRVNRLMNDTSLKETVVMTNRESKGEKIMITGASVREVSDAITANMDGRMITAKGEKKAKETVTISLERLSSHEACEEGDTGTLVIMLVRKDWWESIRGKKGDAEKKSMEKTYGMKTQTYNGKRAGECNESAGTTDEEKMTYYKPNRRPTPAEY